MQVGLKNSGEETYSQFDAIVKTPGRKPSAHISILPPETAAATTIARRVVFRERTDSVPPNEQDGDRGAGSCGFADERGMRRFYRQLRQGLHYLCRSNGRKRHHHVHA